MNLCLRSTTGGRYRLLGAVLQTVDQVGWHTLE